MKIYDNTMHPTWGRRDQAWAGRTPKKDDRKIRSGSKNKDSYVDLRKLQLKYRLNGFEFGNWTDNDDRHDFAVAVETSLLDLSQIVGSTNLGIDALVGIAFGARGRGGSAKAHYEPLFNMINITKSRGTGSLAHEYGHAIDFNFGRYVDQHKRYSALSGGISVASRLESNTGGQLRYYMNKIIDTIKASDSFARLAKAPDYWHERTEVFARFFEQYICYKLAQKKRENTFLTKSWSYFTTRVAYLKEDDFKKVLPDADLLMAEIALFLNNKGRLIAKPYPAAPVTTTVTMPKPEPAEKKVATKTKSASAAKRVVSKTKQTKCKK